MNINDNGYYIRFRLYVKEANQTNNLHRQARVGWWVRLKLTTQGLTY